MPRDVFTGRFVYLMDRVDEASASERVLTIREWNLVTTAGADDAEAEHDPEQLEAMWE